MGEHTQFPFKTLGSYLRKRREMVHESLAEVSGAVEIDMETLSQIEAGTMNPSEDILLLLISHLGVSEKEASRLWDLAGYEDKDNANETSSSSLEDVLGKQLVMLMPFDNRIVYSDTATATINNSGVTINFLQTNTNGQPTPISRVGMSREQAQSLIQILQNTLVGDTVPARPQALLPAPKNPNKTSKPQDA